MFGCFFPLLKTSFAGGAKLYYAGAPLARQGLKGLESKKKKEILVFAEKTSARGGTYAWYL